ncbi:TetR/AcrR family transcriptional regulator [Enterococcus crotali]|uniref:TetR/AcrR family transcriptional regulator n=1 Tax=Enterococcus crotali TaxID=1453587 RepID=UPI000471300E|nr:TetR/AcrR family transcriptional regulator [Enterococcus crotali]
MPPSVRIDKATILNAAIELLNEKGLDAINSRSVAKRIGCSTQPIFSTYGSMSNLLEDVIVYVEDFFFNYLKRVTLDESFFLNIGLSYIQFAQEYKNYFATLFLLNNFKNMTFESYINSDNTQFVRDGIRQLFTIDEARATGLFLDMWIYSHGIACMISTNNINMSTDIIEEMLTNLLYSLLNEKNLLEE